MLTYYSVYGIICFIMVHCATSELKCYNKIFALMISVLLICFTGLRWETGTDWQSYKTVFDTLAHNLSLQTIFSIHHFDIGYIFFNALVVAFTDSYTCFLLFDSLLAVMLIYNVIAKTTKYTVISLLMFYSIYYLGHYFGSNRRIIAIGFLLNAFYAFYNKKYFLYLVFQALAFVFHRSSLIGICVVMFGSSKHRISDVKLLVILCIAIIFGMTRGMFWLLAAIASILNKVIHSYIVYTILYYTKTIQEDRGVVLFGIAVLKRLCYLCVFIFLLKKNKVKDPLLNYCFNIYFFAVVFYICLNGAGVFQVLTTYFSIVEIIIWGRLFQFIKKFDKGFLIAIIFLTGILQIPSAFQMYPDLFLPYASIFNKISRRLY